MNLTRLTLVDVSKLICSQQVSPVELTEAYLHRIETLDGELGTYITVMKEEALESAKTAERLVRQGSYKGPLHGVPIGLKDVYETRGVRTTGGSGIFVDYVPRGQTLRP